ncbi:glycoside hydrolase family 88 protein [Paraburkholderia sp. ZP32-5]|uniref:glycoside hydrolase family 88 protein n=1 Tax=Paraburkholderia sp. ZP32-5 TaxID=2883245 RepID=UPI001F40BF58|nr:glycoside hydrolase family 88 protein [Paraburkholderia sp. ZP32-5]
MSNWLTDGIAAAVSKVEAQASRGGDFPHITQDGKWCTTPDGVWTGGFWAGLLWLSYEVQKSDALRTAATSLTDRLLPRAADAINHDLGFMFYPSAVKGWRITGDDRYLRAALTAAESLAGQFNPQGGFIPGWGFFGSEDWSGSVLIDTLMNLPLLVWAANHGGDARLLEVVHRHAKTALANHQREDGSVFHVYRFNPADGTPIAGDTYQGLDAASAWSRGQGWALAGFAMLADMTGSQEYLTAALRVARYVERHLPQDGVPPWDYSAGGTPVKDSSAGAITAYGFIRLWELTTDARHLDLAETMLQALCSRCLLRDDSAPILAHATADLPHGLGIDESTIYGDYYFLKSLLALRDIKDQRESGARGSFVQTSAG